jgi:uncharacterized protein (DUF2336 family)
MPASFESLKQLAREGSPQRRSELMRAIATAFFDAPTRTSTELDLFDEIMDRVLEEVEPLARRELAERIADLDDAPYRTLRRLARDAIEVAQPVLMRSPALGDEDLAPIAREQSQEHLLAIARRLTLSEMVTDILVERGNDEVAGTVTTNEGARISEAGFEWLAARASNCEIILSRLMVRRDLPECIATDLLPVLATSVASKIEAADAEVTSLSAHKMIADARRLLADRLRTAVSRARPVGILNEQIARGNLSASEAVMEIANADEPVELAAFLALRLGLRPDTIVRNLFGAGEETLMLICRAAALNIDAFAAILRLRGRHLRDGAAEQAQAMKDYLRIPRQMAENVMQTVREREQEKAA